MARTNIFLVPAPQRFADSEPMRNSKNPLKRKTAARMIPRKNEPWQLTQRAKSGGRSQNQRALRDLPR